MSEYLLLKWGSLKGWEFKEENEMAMDAIRRFHEDGVCMSAALQHNTEAQKAALCDLINAIDGEITNDWSGEIMSKDEAKKYVMEYDR